MNRTRRFLVVGAMVLAVNAAPAAAYADSVSDACRDVNDELAKYGWQGNICIVDPPPEDDPVE